MSESGSAIPDGQPLLVITVMGDAVGDIPALIVPVTYREFEEAYPSLLGQLFPARPINPASSEYWYIIICKPHKNGPTKSIVTNFQKKFGVRHTCKNLHFNIQNYKANEFKVSI